MPLIADERIPLEKLISHKVQVEDVENVLATIERGDPLDGKEVVKAMMVPDLNIKS